MHKVKVNDLIKILVDNANSADVCKGMILKVISLKENSIFEVEDGIFEVEDGWLFANSSFDAGLIEFHIASKPVKKFNSKAVKIRNKKRDNLEINLDYDTDPKKSYPMILFTPDMDNTDIHYHIPLSIAEARKMRDWLTKFLKGKK